MTPARLLLLAAALTGAAVWAPDARALTGIQSSSPSLFTLTGTSASPNTLSFTRFNPSIVGDDKKNVTLVGYDYILTNLVASGTVDLGNISAGTINGPFTSQAVLNFDRIDAAAPVVFNPVVATSAGTIPPGSFVNLPLSGTATNVISPDPFLPLASTTNYVSPPGTPLPSLTGYSATWSYISPPGPLSSYTSAVMSGRISVRWHYTYDIQEVPAPLPLAGAGLAFAWSRSLRRRVRSVA